MTYYAMTPVQLGVCLGTGETEAGSWTFRTVNIPASTPKRKIHAAARTALLEYLPDCHVYHTWVQCVGGEVREAEDEDQLEALVKEIENG